MTSLPALARLVAALERLPGIGPKSARRVAHFLLTAPPDASEGLSAAILAARERTRSCSVCHALTEQDPCTFCVDPARDGALLAVVEEPFDVEVLERTREFRGRYHVLGGALAPLRGIGPDDLHVASLLERAASGVAEVVLATNPNVEGEATALYLARRLKPLGVRVTRIAFGLPVGAAIEFADEVTLGRSLSGRREV
ncbi:MAG TPA: recombination mediator RecR [Thermoanaerobaculia bacterium]|nr:recombination mediator RecR [Thermoanaerobaculia bacterium]